MFFGALRIEKVIFSHRLRTEASHFRHIYKTVSFVSGNWRRTV